MRTETIEFGIYGVAVALLGLLVWKGWETKNDLGEGWKYGPKDKKEFTKLRDDLEAAGNEEQPDEKRLSYSSGWIDWWKTVQTANWTGKLPPPPPVTVDPTTEVEEKVEEVLEPLGDLMEVTAIMAGNGDDATRIVIRYKRDVTPPASAPALGSGTSTNGTGAMPSDFTNSAVSDATGQPFHTLIPGDRLWKPLNSIQFKGVDLFKVPLTAIFTRPKANGKDGETVDQELALAQLGLGDAIDDETKSELGASSSVSSSKSDGIKERKWQSPGERTTRVGDVWMISERDSGAFETDYDRILTEDFVTNDYISRKADKKTGERIRGVSFTRVSDSVRRFGVQSGDVLIAVNGQSVTSKANAMNVGRKQYDRGVRTFELEFLSGGRKVTRTYTAPQKK